MVNRTAERTRSRAASRSRSHVDEHTAGPAGDESTNLFSFSVKNRDDTDDGVVGNTRLPPSRRRHSAVGWAIKFTGGIIIA